MATVLADGNLLIALTVSDHVHHEAAIAWFDPERHELATCPITEGTLLRFLVREGLPSTDAIRPLEAIRSRDWHRFWPADIAYEPATMRGVIGHRQLTDLYLVALARHHGGSVATFDRGLALLHGEEITLLDG